MKLLHITRALQVILLLFVVNPINANNQTELETCDSLYELGVNVYLENQWKECIEYFQKAIVLYNKHKEITVNCRIKCQMDVDSMDTMFLYNVENLQFYEKMVRKTLCILKCLQSQIKHVPRGFILSKQTEKLFEQRKPYEFLQLCYFQTNQLQESANSAFTFLVRNPGNEVMLKNLKYYFTLPEVDQEAIVNYESEPYVTMYIHGSDAYSHEDWPAVIANMEESLINYLDSEEKCRAFCEGSFNQGWFPDFTSSISNHFTYCLKCKSKCASNLNTLNGEEHDDLLGSHYHFLQYAYYKIGNLRDACAAVASYLLFYPNDVTMITNKEFYNGMPKVTEEYFTPRTEAIRYVQRMHYEQKLLKFIGEEFVFEDEEDKEIDNEIATEDREQLLQPPTMFEPNDLKVTIIKAENQNNKKEDFSYNRIDKNKDKKIQAINRIKRMASRNIKMNKQEIDLNGTLRFLADGFATDFECQELMSLAQIASIQGDGYYGNVSPHTAMENFSGVTLGRAALLVYFGLMDASVLKLFLSLSLLAKDYVQVHFNLKTELYFTYTHLACRSAIPNGPLNRTDWSHAVHADNCVIQPSGECVRQPPAFTWRDYSVIIYLNDDFQGGDFIFSEDSEGTQIQSKISPTCGRLIGFSSGPENLHGVEAVRRGTRCAIGLWFTLDSDHQELERELALQVLKQIDQYGDITDQMKADLDKFAKSTESSENNNLHDENDM